MHMYTVHVGWSTGDSSKGSSLISTVMNQSELELI